MQQTRITLEQNEIPTHWYNVVADMPNPPLPPLGPTATRWGRSRCWRSSPATCSSRK
jgi:predicted alternative tryptophan synthase beta-subunit